MEIVAGEPFIIQIKEMIKTYTDMLARDLSFQNLDDELVNPEEKYCPPMGEVLVALENREILGMVAYHRHSDERCEMKRLFVYPQYRRRSVGEKLVEEIIRRAKMAGYREMVLDTLAPMKEAIALYRKNGFAECEPYYFNPFPDVIYMKKTLSE